jgi:putative methyltransferase (TIGR04325 family)
VRSRLRDMVRLLLPPLAFKITARMRAPAWEYVSDTWPANDSRSSGWDDSSWVEQFRANWPAYLKTVHSTDPLTVFPWRVGQRDLMAHNALMTYSYVLARAALGVKAISVLDWGGAFGHYAVVGRAVLPDVAIDYTVKDRLGMVDVGRQLTQNVLFTSSDEECFSRRYDLVIASNALQISPDWKSVARKLADSARRYLLIVVPIVQSVNDFVVVQRPQSMADYISWVFNHKKFVSQIEEFRLTLVREFLVFGPQQIRRAPEMPEMIGFLFYRADDLPEGT